MIIPLDWPPRTRGLIPGQQTAQYVASEDRTPAGRDLAPQADSSVLEHDADVSQPLLLNRFKDVEDVVDHGRSLHVDPDEAAVMLCAYKDPSQVLCAD